MQVEAVRTTGIYCRADCSAEPLPQNVTHYSNPVAAEVAGFRPCLRCHPERRAGSLADLDVPAPIGAALLRINDGFLDAHDEEALASAVGYSGRQLRRLFEQHVGATPTTIARSRRAHFARRLIDDTDLTFAEIARAAGFGGPRQLHRAMTSVFCFTPTELRSKRRRGEYAELDGGLVLEVPTLAPYDFGTFVTHQECRAIPGTEAVADGETGPTYARSFNACGHPGIAEVTAPPDGDEHLQLRHAELARGAMERAAPPDGDEHLQLRLHLPTYDSIIDAVSRVRALLGTDEDPAPAARALGDDLVIGPLVRTAPGLRVPRSWDRFETAVRIIVGQQISLAAASTLSGRIAERFGTPIDPVLECCDDVLVPLTHLFPGAATLASAGGTGFAGLGFTQQRIDTIVGFSQAVAGGELDLTASDTLTATVARLCELPGIGPWTAHLIAMRVFGHDDAFPASDLGLRRSAERLVGHSVSARELEALAENWRPYRSWAAQHLWHASHHSASNAR
ncbi:MAG: DNA-3-methyladenine glycosylase 2 family protein [Acidimicrobiales bacterium]|nr:DNA-3-methyladenine glycosylase 2 family protein [Acidimicrobiales bacterium]MYH73808.1 DNA-3-methyladenine glycosylase 2 family protein [Acidimicrobiales bacterium]MYK71134.1 DNA-3-methyladenine glycosylase 2 family protein [Acidimicrobiales bacterium]